MKIKNELKKSEKELGSFCAHYDYKDLFSNQRKNQQNENKLEVQDFQKSQIIRIKKKIGKNTIKNLRKRKNMEELQFAASSILKVI